MAFVAADIEDGTGKSTAIVYGRTADPVDEASAYLTRRGRTAFTSLVSDAVREQHLIRATEYVELIGHRRAHGSKSVREQTLLWPRQGVDIKDHYITSTMLPEGWLRAIWEAAEKSAAGEPLSNIIDDERDVSYKQVAAHLVTQWFASHSKLKRYLLIEDLMRPLMRPLGMVERG